MLSESDIDYGDVRYHIMFEIAMETHIVMTPTSIGSRRNLLSDHKQQQPDRTGHFNLEE